MRAGQTVQAGDILLHLDETPSRERLETERLHEAALAAQLAALRRETLAAAQSATASGRAGEAAATAARRTAAGATATARAVEDRARRDRALLAAGLLPAAESARLAASDDERRSSAAAQTADLDRQAWTAAASAAGRRQQRAALDRETARLTGDLAASRAALAALSHLLAAHTLRAPAAGRIIDLAPLALGANLLAGARLGALLLAGARNVVALLPETAWDRVHPGQPAWIEPPAGDIAPLPGTVSRIAGNPRGGAFPVELTCPGAAGLPPSLQVHATLEVERTTPAALLWRRLLLERPRRGHQNGRIRQAAVLRPEAAAGRADHLRQTSVPGGSNDRSSMPDPLA
jgi:multidrug resistance efflux pump